MGANVIAERVLLVGLVFAYLLTFDQVLPHGDALRIVRQVETAHLVWNPNHLFFDPLGYAIAWMANVRDREGVLEIFERVSIFATLVSLWVFHGVLVRAAVGRWARVVLCIGLFASASFLAVAGSQYYFMVQMPLLIAALYLYIDFIIQLHEERAVYRNVYGIGVLLALATAVMFNNLLLVIGAGVAVGFTGRSLKRPDFGLSLRLFLAAGLVGFPLFILGYSLAAAESGFLRWLVSYEGDSGSVLNDFYGISWTLVGVAEAAARAAFNYALGNVVEHAGLGTVLWVLAFGHAVEFVPQWSRIMLGLVAIPPAVLMTGWATLFAVRRAATSSLARFLLAWTGAFISFNILWNCNDAIFWFQILPATWLLVAMSMGLLSHRALLEEPARTPWMSGKSATTLLGALVGLLLIVNTGNLVMPLADRDYYVKQAQHAALLRDGDLEIVPGWDQQKWMSLPSDAPKAQQVVLMSLGLSGGDSLASMPDRIHSQLEGGGRVVVARLFDIDSDLMPWYALRRLGWPRSRIQGLLSGYCTREIGRVGGVVFRELHRCAGASGGGN